MFEAALLQAKISAVCPIVGIGIGDPTNPATWRIDYDPSATAAQQAAAAALLAQITPTQLAAANASVIAAMPAPVDPLASALASAVLSLATPTAIP